MDYKEINKKLWNNKVDIHYDSEFYDNENFLKGKSSLNEIELAFMKNLKGKKVLHLQCHFGQDSISMSKLGAEVTGVDLSDKAIEKGRALAQEMRVDTQFICSDIYDLPNHLEGKFDFVFTSYGTIGWLPDLDQWAKVITHFLKPEGEFLIVEFHPFIWMYDDDFKGVNYTYFNSGPIKEEEEGTYAEKDADLKQEFVCWNHGLSEVMTHLLNNEMEITHFSEYNYSPYNCFNQTIEFEPGKFRIEPFGDKVPLVYALSAQKKT